MLPAWRVRPERSGLWAAADRIEIDTRMRHLTAGEHLDHALRPRALDQFDEHEVRDIDHATDRQTVSPIIDTALEHLARV